MKSKGKLSTVQRTIIEIKIHKTISFRVGCFRWFMKKTKMFGNVVATVLTHGYQETCDNIFKHVNIFVLYFEKSKQIFCYIFTISDVANQRLNINLY